MKLDFTKSWRTRRFFLFGIASLMLFAFFASCGSEKPKDKPTQSRKIFFFHGNPMALVEYSNQNTVGFGSEFIQQSKDFHLALVHAFMKESETEGNSSSSNARIANGLLSKAVLRNAQVESENQTQFRPGLNVLRSYRFQKFKSNRYIYSPKNKALKDFGFEFTSENDLVKLNSVLIVGENNGFYQAPVEVVHHSLHQSKDAFSLLVKEASTGNLFHFAFTRNKASQGRLKLGELDTKYTYLFGPGVKTKWNSKPVLTICKTPKSEQYDQLLFDAANEWKKSLPELEIRMTSDFKPFSDLNQSCLILADAYKFKEEEEGNTTSGTLGITIPTVDFTSQNILSAPIFLFLSTIKKLSFHLDSQIRATVKHEVGHFLGLGHEFRRDRTTGNYIYQSIMGYDPYVSNITQHDRLAIRALYHKGQDEEDPEEQGQGEIPPQPFLPVK